MTNILFIVQFPPKITPSQRFRIELYEDLLISQRIGFHTSSFFDSKGQKILYSKGKTIKKVWAVCKGFMRRIKDLSTIKKYDYVFVHREASPVGPPIFEFIYSKILRKKMIYDFDDSVWVPAISENNKIARSVKCFWKIKLICKWAYKVSAGNEYLANFARKYNSNVVLNPTCVDTTLMHNRLKTHNEGQVSIGWTGTFSGINFLDQVIPVLKELEKKYSFDFILIADRDPKLPINGYKFIKWNRETEIEDLSRFDIGIMPLPDTEIAKGKCGFKIIQFLALGIPAIASPIGVNSKIIDEGVNGFLCGTSQEWHEALEKLILDRGLRGKMGKDGRQKMQEKFSIDSNAANFLSLFDFKISNISIPSKQRKIGYVPYSRSLRSPGDRRRFPFYAEREGIEFEIAEPNKDYDIILLTCHSNLSQWLLYKKEHSNTKFIFEMVDSIIFSSDLFRDIFKGAGRYLQGKENKLSLNYKTPIIQWLKAADVVLCSSTELKRIISKWNKDVLISLDYLQNEVKYRKTDYEIKGKMKLVWEGQSVVFENLLHFKDVFKAVSSFCELHVITDKVFDKFGGLMKVDTKKLLEELPIETTYHEWKLFNNYEILSQCDCGIIPINRKNKMAWYKPANKLISFWFAGMPTIVTNTPAYSEIMGNVNSDLYCSTTEEWVEKIAKMKNISPREREGLAKKNLTYVQTHFSNEQLTLNWEDVFKYMREGNFAMEEQLVSL